MSLYYVTAIRAIHYALHGQPPFVCTIDLSRTGQDSVWSEDGDATLIAPIDIHLHSYYRAVRKRDARAAGGTTRLYFKFARTNILLVGVSETGQ